jgi:hypothetical protein
MDKRILVPIPLAVRIIELLGYWDTSMYDRAIRDEYEEILQFFSVKMRKLELRNAYTKIIAAENEDRRHDARIDYLSLRAQLYDYYTAD